MADVASGFVVLRGEAHASHLADGDTLSNSLLKDGFVAIGVLLEVFRDILLSLEDENSRVASVSLLSDEEVAGSGDSGSVGRSTS